MNAEIHNCGIGCTFIRYTSWTYCRMFSSRLIHVVRDSTTKPVKLMSQAMAAATRGGAVSRRMVTATCSPARVSVRNEVVGPGGRHAEEVPRHDLIAVGEY